MAVNRPSRTRFKQNVTEYTKKPSIDVKNDAKLLLINSKIDAKLLLKDDIVNFSRARKMVPRIEAATTGSRPSSGNMQLSTKRNRNSSIRQHRKHIESGGMLNGLSMLLMAPLLVAATTPIQGSFTLTAHKPGDAKFDAAKVNYVGGVTLFKEKVRQYCPQPPVQSCPNGTDAVWANGLYPSAMVPGGQDTYVLANGQLLITPQHSHSKPGDAFWGYEGFSCSEGLPNSYTPPGYSSCPSSDPLYDCRQPTGLCTWKLPKQHKGGVFACRNPYDPAGTVIFVKTPHFNQTGCTELDGLAVHPYDGPIPVWSYV